ncbi:MAG: DNA-protecting protein DprA [Candidatus Liptonbacteria bacterium]|nr:DNA-protecting protein DprA [Candidatus Liptonbacteria bacterium]
MNDASESEKIFYNAVWNSTGCSHREIKKLKSTAASWKEIFEKTKKSNVATAPEKDFEKLEKAGIKLILEDEPDFPELLHEIYWSPFGIYVKGEINVLKKLCIAIVGTRKATEDSVDIAGRFGSELARAGATITSGLAFGIDSSVHKGCIDAGGKTVAVLACGLDGVYPKSNERLAREIISSGGAIISEYPPGNPPLPYRFIERNRIISGVSGATIVIEAPESSGSLTTARFALDQNREVFVVPGPANHRNFSGSHRLIRSGARLVGKPSDVLEDLNIIESSVDDGDMTSEEKAVFEILKNSRNPLDIDKISEIANLESRVANQTVTLLLLKNLIKEEGEGYVSRK